MSVLEFILSFVFVVYLCLPANDGAPPKLECDIGAKEKENVATLPQLCSSYVMNERLAAARNEEEQKQLENNYNFFHVAVLALALFVLGFFTNGYKQSMRNYLFGIFLAVGLFVYS